MTEFTINRAKWATGVNGYNGCNHLLNEDGTMCCLGFFCNRIARIPKKDLLETPSPDCLDSDYLKNKPSLSGLVSESVAYGTFNNTKNCGLLMNINDSEEIPLKEKEREIKKIFKELGYSVKFVGKLKEAEEIE